MTDSIVAVVKDMRNSIAHDGYRTVSTRCAPYTMVEEWADRLAAMTGTVECREGQDARERPLSPAGSGLTANSEPVAWQHGIAGNANIVTYNGEDIRPIGRAASYEDAAMIIKKHNALLKEIAALTADNERLARVAGRLFKQVEHKPKPP